MMDKLKRTLIGMLSCLLFSFGVAGSLIYAYRLEGTLPLPYAFLLVAAAVILFTALTYNIYCTLSWAVVFLIAILVVAVRFAEQAGQFVKDVMTPFIKEMSLFLAGLSGISEGSAFALAVLICAMPVVLSLFYLRLGAGEPFLIPAALILFAAEWHLGHFGILPFAALSAMGIIINYALGASVWQGGLSRRVFYGRRSGGVPTAEAAAGSSLPAVYALIAAPVILIGAFYLSDRTRLPSMPLFAEYANRLAGLSSPYSFYTENPSFTTSSVGFSQNSSRLGGRLSLSSEPVFLLTGLPPSPFLRGAVYDTYEGDRWINTFPSEKYPFDYENYADEYEAAFNQGYTGFISRRPDVPFFHRAGRYTVTLLRPGYTKLFLAGTPRADEVSAGRYALSFNAQGEMFASFIMGSGDSYTVSARAAVPYVYFERPDFLYGEMDEDLPEGWYRYLYVPENIRGELKALTEEIIAGYLNVRGDGPPDLERYSVGLKCSALISYFQDRRSGFSYTLSPPTVPSGEDFVMHFLENKKGYCTYYASAMTLMLRSIGIPARYVEGFKPDITALYLQEGGSTPQIAVTTDSAHAWVEVCIDGVGWAPYDPTVGYSNSAEEAYVGLPSEEPSTESPSPEPTGLEPSVSPSSDELPASPTPSDNVPESPDTDNRETPEGGAAKTILFLILLPSLAAAYVFAYVFIRRYLISPKRLHAAFTDNAARVRYCYRRIAKNLALLGSPAKHGETLTDYALRTSGILGDGDVFMRVGLITSMALYSEQDITDEDTAFMAETALRLERLAFKKARLKYILGIKPKK